jgi:uncharacterized protein YqfB (UPF0267 family)
VLHVKTGYALVLSFEKNIVTDRRRSWSEFNTENFERIFKALGAFVKILVNSTKPVNLETISELLTMDWSSYDHFIVAISPHGIRDAFELSDSSLMKIEYFQRQFEGLKCPEQLGNLLYQHLPGICYQL